MAKLRDYETTFVLRPDMEEETREELIERIKSIITDNSGEITNIDDWGSKKMAYEINDYKSGYYSIIDFKGTSATIEELERNYKIITDVLRYINLRKEN